MSEKNLEVIRDQYAAVNERDWDRAMGHYAEDVELVVPTGGIRGGTFRGLDAVGEWFGDWLSSFASDARFDLKEVTELADGGVLVVADHHARGRASGVEVRGDVVWVYRLRDGKITQVQAYDSRADALEAAGDQE